MEMGFICLNTFFGWCPEKLIQKPKDWNYDREE